MEQDVRADHRLRRTPGRPDMADHRPLGHDSPGQHRVQLDGAIDRDGIVQSANTGQAAILELRLVDHGEERIVPDVGEQLHACGAHARADVLPDGRGEADDDVPFPARLDHRTNGAGGGLRRHPRRGLRAGAPPPDLPAGDRDHAGQDKNRQHEPDHGPGKTQLGQHDFSSVRTHCKRRTHAAARTYAR